MSVETVGTADAVLRAVDENGVRHLLQLDKNDLQALRISDPYAVALLEELVGLAKNLRDGLEFMTGEEFRENN